METMLDDDPSTFNNKSVVSCAVRSQPVDKYLKMLSSYAVLVPPVKRCSMCKGCVECKKTHLPDPARQEEQITILKQNLQYCPATSKYKASYTYNELLPTLPVYEAACKRVAISLERKLVKDGLHQAFTNCIEDFIENGVLKYPEPRLRRLQRSYIPLTYTLRQGGTTPLRVCGNSSFRSGDNLTLNECALSGPNFYRI